MLNINPQPSLPPVRIIVSKKQVIRSLTLFLTPAPNCAQVFKVRAATKEQQSNHLLEIDSYQHSENLRDLMGLKKYKL